jgi:hypothetical protein
MLWPGWLPNGPNSQVSLIHAHGARRENFNDLARRNFKT